MTNQTSTKLTRKKPQNQTNQINKKINQPKPQTDRFCQNQVIQSTCVNFHVVVE